MCSKITAVRTGITSAGTVEPDWQAFTISAENLSNVQYIGGSSAGTDTLTIDAYDATHRRLDAAILRQRSHSRERRS